MKTLLLLSLNTIASLFVVDNADDNNVSFPDKQITEDHTLIKNSDFYYSQTGQFVESKNNSSYSDRFFVYTNTNDTVEIKLTNTNKVSHGYEIGYLARILSAETLVYEKHNKAYNVSMYARVCIAESIKNRTLLDYGYYERYNSYKSVITNTGYATNAKEYRNPYSWLENKIAKKRFVQEVLPVAIYVYYNETNFTNGATGFITPAKMSNEMYQRFQKKQLIEIKGIDPFYEFTFWK